MGDTGFDTPPDVQTKTANLAVSAARALQSLPDLNRLVELWPNLPEPVRQSILVLAAQFGQPQSSTECGVPEISEAG